VDSCDVVDPVVDPVVDVRLNGALLLAAGFHFLDRRWCCYHAYHLCHGRRCVHSFSSANFVP